MGKIVIGMLLVGLIIAAMLGGFAVGNDIGHQDGFDAGYQYGFKECEEGYFGEIGIEEMYDVRYEKGYEEGINEGFGHGLEFGVDIGMASGYIDGYQDGSGGLYPPGMDKYGDTPKGFMSFDEIREFHLSDPKWRAAYNNYIANQPPSLCSSMDI